MSNVPFEAISKRVQRKNSKFNIIASPESDFQEVSESSKNYAT